jgi:uncharacterized RDD family membrane protein YckC
MNIRKRRFRCCLFIRSGGALKTYGSFWQRVKAFLFDYVLILVYLAIITLIFLLLRNISGIIEWLFADRIRAQITGFFILTLPVSLYFAIGEASLQQATWGKQRVGLKVEDRSGNRIGFGRSLVRTILKFVPWELSHTLLWNIAFSIGSSTLINYGYALVYLLIGLNIVSVFLTQTKQSFYDLIAGTVVVK